MADLEAYEAKLYQAFTDMVPGPTLSWEQFRAALRGLDVLRAAMNAAHYDALPEGHVTVPRQLLFDVQTEIRWARQWIERDQGEPSVALERLDRARARILEALGYGPEEVTW